MVRPAELANSGEVNACDVVGEADEGARASGDGVVVEEAVADELDERPGDEGGEEQRGGKHQEQGEPAVGETEPRAPCGAVGAGAGSGRPGDRPLGGGCSHGYCCTI